MYRSLNSLIAYQRKFIGSSTTRSWDGNWVSDWALKYFFRGDKRGSYQIRIKNCYRRLCRVNNSFKNNRDYYQNILVQLNYTQNIYIFTRYVTQIGYLNK